MQLLRVAMGVAAVLLLGVSAAVPQVNIVLGALAIDLWPDYDRPGVLVIYRATIAPEVSLPARLRFRTPSAVGSPSAVAERAVDGELLTLPYERTLDGETALIDLTASRPIVQLEYYDPAITRDGSRRSFVFTWRGDFEVRDFAVSVQQPHLSQNFTTVPETTGGTGSADGLIYHTLSRAGVKAGESVEVRVSYEKDSDQLSAESITPPAPPAPPTALTPIPATGNAAASDSQIVRIVLAALFACAVTIVVGVMVRTRQQSKAAPQSTSHRRRTRSGQSGVKSRFCTQCGAGVGAGDRFCQRCGAAVKA